MDSKQFYLYCNSGATSVTGALGFVVGPFGDFRKKSPIVKHKGFYGKKCYTTTEYAFAREFTTLAEAHTYNQKHGLPCIIMQKVD